MTTSSRMDQSIRPGYPHQHHVLQESLHPHHPFSLATTTSSSNSNGSSSSSMDGVIHGTHSINNNIPLPPLACLSEAAAAISSAVQQQQQQHPLGRDHHHRYHAGHPMTTTSNPTPTATTTTSSKLTGASLGNGNNYKEGDGGSRPQLPSPESSSSHHQHQPTPSSSSLATLSTFGSTTLSSLSTVVSTTTTSSSSSSSSSNHGSSLFDHSHSQETMNTASAGTAVHEETKRPGDHDGARRGSIPDNHHYSHQYNQGGHQSGSLTTPAPSPHGRPSSASSADYPPQPPSSSITPDHHQQPSSYQQQRYSNGHPTSAPSPDHHYNNKDQHYPSQPYPSQHPAPPSQLTPSPPLPSPADGFQGRPLPPIEPSHPLHSYMSNSRRGSVTDPADYHTSVPDVHKRSSISAMDSSSFYNSNGNSNGISNNNGSSGPVGPGGQESRHYANSSPSSGVSSNSEPHYPPYPHPSTSPMQLRQSEHASGRRESLPSIHSSAGPLGQLLAQEPQRRHSIAHGDQMMGPLKRKTSSTPLSQMLSSSELEHPAKRRDSIPDAAHPHHHHHHPYPPRSSFSAPSSPPRRGSNAMMHGPVPTLNLQPAAEIKSSMMPSSSASALHSGPSGPSVMDHVRPHFPLHQPRRPSLLSDASLSRRSSVADNHHYPSHYQPSSSSSHNQDYDHNMDMDMERMHLHGPPDHPHQQPPGPLGPGGQPGNHLYPGYPAGYPGGENGHKGDTPYSRSPELRVSHKLAERKRRKEMKELFDELRDALPVDRSLKTSKWEILSKAVDYISGMRENQEAMSKEIDMLRQEVARLKNL